MTLTELISTALDRMGRNTGGTEKYESKFKLYANEAIRKIAEKRRACRSETVTLVDESFNISSLEREVFEDGIVKILDADGVALDFDQIVDGSGDITVDTEETSVTVVYRYVPSPLENSPDEPDLPTYLHGMIVYWICGCERSNGDPDTMEGAATDFQLFNQALNDVKPAKYGAPGSRKLLNY